MSDDAREDRTIPRWVIVLAVVVLGPLVLYALFFAHGHRRVRALEKSWAEDGRSFADLVARHPDVATNDAAHEVEALAARWGIDIVPKPDGGGAPPAAFGFKLNNVLGPYLEAELSSAASTPSAPPTEIAAWLRQHADDIDALANRLVTEPAPRWISEPSRGQEAPIPNLLGHVKVQRVLVAAALDHGHEARTEQAQSCLDAAWKLNESLWVRPELISQLIAGSAARLQFGALRKIDDLPESWDDRLAQLDVRAPLATALQLGAGAYVEFARSPKLYSIHGGESDFGLAGKVGRPVLLAGAAGAGDRVRQLVALDAAQAPCVPDQAVLDAKLPPLSSWNPVDKMLGGHETSAVVRAAHVSFHAEMTRHVLRARRERKPTVVTGSCPQWIFRTEVLSDGSVTVALDGALPPDPSTGLHLPLRWGPDPPAPE